MVANPRGCRSMDAKEFIAAAEGASRRLQVCVVRQRHDPAPAAEQFLDQTATTSRHIPYKGVGSMIADIMGGPVDWGEACRARDGRLSQGRCAQSPHRPTGVATRRACNACRTRPRGPFEGGGLAIVEPCEPAAGEDHGVFRSSNPRFMRIPVVQDRAENRVTLHTSCTPFVLEWKQIEGGSSWVLFRTTPPPHG